MMQPMLLAICREHGHLIVWSDSTSAVGGPPPGWYQCLRCHCIVEVGYNLRAPPPT